MIMKYCGRCDKNLPGEKAWFKHRTYSRRHHICYKCGETDFESRVDYNNHRYVDNRHKYCDQCDLEFDVASDLQTHCAQGHTYCDVCGDHFRDAKDLKKHFVKSGEHAYCGQCQFHFHAETNLREHRNGATHRPKTYGCKGCGGAFVSSAAVVLHWETGRCPSSVNIDTVNLNIHEFDWYEWIITRSYDDLFYCPGRECNAEFLKFSALVQHARSRRCGFHQLDEYKKLWEYVGRMNRSLG